MQREELHYATMHKERKKGHKGAEVVLLGDGEYDETEMAEWVQTQTDWYFVLRTSPHIKVRQGQVWRKVGIFSKQKRIPVAACQVAFTHTAALSLNLVAWWEPPTKSPST